MFPQPLWLVFCPAWGCPWSIPTAALGADVGWEAEAALQIKWLLPTLASSMSERVDYNVSAGQFTGLKQQLHRYISLEGSWDPPLFKNFVVSYNRSGGKWFSPCTSLACQDNLRFSLICAGIGISGKETLCSAHLLLSGGKLPLALQMEPVSSVCSRPWHYSRDPGLSKLSWR